MKQLLFIALLCLTGYGAMAQAGSLTIDNNTGCTVYYRIFGGPISACNGTGSGPILSTLIAVGPGVAFTYPSIGSIPGFPSGGGVFVFGALAYFGPTACSSATRRVGEPCSGLTLTNPPYISLESNCSNCLWGMVTPLWITSGVPGGSATLQFN